MGQMRTLPSDENSKIRHGKGVMIYLTNGMSTDGLNGIKRVYEGDWVNDYREGNGYECYSNQNEYLGGFKHNKSNGTGIYRWR